VPIGDLETFLGVRGGKWGAVYINYKLYMVSCDFILIKDWYPFGMIISSLFLLANVFSKFKIQKWSDFEGFQSVEASGEKHQKYQKSTNVNILFWVCS
jgi:hypothetical protein